MPIHCGTEIGVASTKAFLGQILILYILALKLGLMNKNLEKKSIYWKVERFKKITWIGWKNINDRQ